jgi:hypothetical protein
VFKDVDDSPVFKKKPADVLRETFGKTDYDIVDKPKHYMLFDQMDATAFAYANKGIEVRDVLKKLVDKAYLGNFTPDDLPMTMADYVQMMQYLMRFMDKNGVEDLKKARWYLDKMIDAYE